MTQKQHTLNKELLLMRTAPIKYKQFHIMDEELTYCGREKREGRRG